MYHCCGYTLFCSDQCLPLFFLTPLPPIPLFSTAFNTQLYVLGLHRCYVLWYCWCSIILFSFPSFPEFHRVVPLLQTCSTYEIVHDYFYVYVYLLDLSSTPCMRENMRLLSFWVWLTSLNMSPPMASIYLQITYHYSLWLSNTPLCINTTISWSSHQL
jgi:hypothetical protein